MQQREMLRGQGQAAVTVRPRLVPRASQLREQGGDVQRVGQKAVVSQTFRRDKIRLHLEPRLRRCPPACVRTKAAR